MEGGGGWCKVLLEFRDKGIVVELESSEAKRQL